MKRQLVLVVEDDAAVSRVLERILSRAGIAVSVVSNGEQALEFLSTTSVDGLITDIHMPKLGGRELYEELRSRGTRFPAFTLVVTGRSGPEERRWIGQIPNAELVEKPVSPRRLLEVVSERLARLDPADANEQEKAA
jgi:CheY-like chemotaxis protein